MVAVLLAGAFVVVMSANLLTTALPTIMTAFEIDTTTVQWLTSGYSLVDAVVTPLSAYFLGKFRVKRLYSTGLCFYIAGCIIAIFAPVFPVLLAGRMMQAIAAGIMMPMSITLIMLIFPREKRGTANGIVSLVISFAPAIGPTVGGLIIDAVGWRALFMVMMAIGIVLLVLAIAFVTDYEGFEGYGLDIPSVVLMSLGMVCLLYGISSSTSASSIVLPIALIVVGIVVLALFAKRQLGLEQPMLKVDVLFSRRYRVDVIAIAFMQAALFGCAVIMPLYVQNVLGYSASVSGLVMLPGAIFGAAIGLVSGRLYDRYGVRGLAVVGITITLVAALGLTTYQVDSPIWYVTLVYTIIPFGIQMLTPVLNTWGVNSLDNKVLQHANALSGSLNQVAGSIGTALLTALTALSATVAPNASELEQLYIGDHLAFIGAFCIILIAALIVYVGARDKESDLVPAMATATAAGTGEAVATEPAYRLTPEGRRMWTVADVMDSDCRSIRSDQTIGDALDIIVETYTSGLPVVDDEDKVVGYLSDGDVMGYLGDNNVLIVNDPSGTSYRIVDDKGIHENLAALRKVGVMSLASSKVVTLEPDDSLERACAVLAQRRIKKAPVVEDGKLVGMASRRDIICYIVENVPDSVQGIEREN